MPPSTIDIDRIVGQRIRQRRKGLGISQKQLGHHLGLTYSQVQKYERGSNRISAGRLYKIAEYLSVATSYFFEDLQGPDHPAFPEAGNARPSEIRQLTESFSQISNPKARACVLGLVRSLTNIP